MDTEIFVLQEYIDNKILSEHDKEKIKKAADILRNGGLVAFPTETVYGLGGNALLNTASAAIYKAKGRPSDNPLIVHISTIEELGPLVKKIPKEAELLAEKYWPGPLTMIFEKADIVPYETTGGLDTVAVRMPSHSVAAELIRQAGLPVAAPSANVSGRPSPTTAAHCIEDLTGRVDAIIDGGSADIGVESSIVDLSGERPILLRPGAVTIEMLRDTLGMEIGMDAALKGPLRDGERPKAPGMKYRHYAPKAPMTLIVGDNTVAFLEKILAMSNESKSPMLLCTSELIDEIKGLGEKIPENVRVMLLGSRNNPKGIAAMLFDALRETDAENADMILAEGISEDHIGMAVMNRMKKAAGWKIDRI